ncbi:hypothetical protein [Streptomyces paromomycinus]|uniref:Uncharacterized protein n=1 Tax=Streptomyces paromomycinus TaxID=92743 RepID=A0A401W480_STREY|nr:hypothetical protein [Streptomyces paromomycinus]GCD44137.1 hypothetical protein GKJPGBOP_03828 [Streptomyces paromomycinus]
MRVNKYAVTLDNGDVIRTSGTRNEAHARQIIEQHIKDGTSAQSAGRPSADSTDERCAGRTIDSIQLVERGRWG